MDKIYRILRNNHETGPFSLDELLRQNLKPSDMIWVEGSSNAWGLFSEMELRPSFQKVAAPVQPKIQTGVPLSDADEIEAKAEEIRKKVLAYSLNQSSTKATAPVRMYKDPVPPPPLTERNNIDIISHKTKKRNILSELVVTAAVIGLFATGIFNRSLFKGNSTSPNVDAVKILSEDEHAARPETNNTAASSQPVQTSVDSSALITSPALKPVVKPRVTRAKTVAPVKKIEIAKTETSNANSENTAAPTNQKSDATPEIESKKEIVASNHEDDEVKEKKKTFGQAIRGIFKKKKKD